jgi:endonuclease III
MATTKTKSVSVPQILETFRKLFPDAAELTRMSLLECVLFSILRENHSFDSAVNALERLANRDNFIDWNDLRVSDLEEIRSYLPDYPDADQRGTAIKRFLRELFRKNYKFEVEGLSRKTWKEAREELGSYETLGNDFHLSQVQVLTFGGHAFPVDQRIALMLTRLGIAEDSNDIPTIRGLLEKNISKAQILQAIRLFELFVENICTTTAPKCSTCPLAANCNDYQLRLNPPKPAAKPPEPKKAEKKAEAVTAPPAPANQKSESSEQKSKKNAPAAPAATPKASEKKPATSEKAAAPVKSPAKPQAAADKKTAAAPAKPVAKPAPAKPPEKPKATVKPAPAKAAPAKPAPAKSAVKSKPKPAAKATPAKPAPAKNDKQSAKKK